MHFSSLLDSELRKQLTDQGSLPPQEFVAALLAYGQPAAVLTYRLRAADGEHGWRSVARSAGGLLIVEASSDDDDFWTWSEFEDRRPQNATVASSWYSLRSISAVRYVPARSWWTNDGSGHCDVHVEGEWTLVVGGHPQSVVLDRTPGGFDSYDVVDDFCRDLLKAVTTASS